MKPTLFHFLIELPGTDMGLCWIGGGLRRSKRPGYVWLTGPDGRPVLEAPACQVHPSTPEDTARRFLAERRLAKTPLN
jgi:hypothetical protein